MCVCMCVCVRLDSSRNFCLNLVVSVCIIPEDGSAMLACLYVYVFLVSLA